MWGPGEVYAMRRAEDVAEFSRNPARLYDLLRETGPVSLAALYTRLFGQPFSENVFALTPTNNFFAAIEHGVRIGLITATPEWVRHDYAGARSDYEARVQQMANTLIAPDPKAQRLFNGLGFSFSHLAQLKGRPIIVSPAYESGQYPTAPCEVFCIFPFRKPHDAFFAKVVKPAIEDLGLTVQLAIEHNKSTFISEEIFNSIMAARIVVADCTGANPNVLYEVGLAHAVGKPVILLTQRDKDIPFDLRHIRYLKFRNFSKGGLPIAELKKALNEQIAPPQRADAMADA